jgi:cholesterol transport system auxiliary component
LASLIAAGTGLLLAAALSGCISLLPKSKPVQLDRFGESPAATAAAAGASRTVGVVLGSIGFPRAAVGDQLLTVTGNTAAYISGARWVAPAAVLFQEDTERAFDRDARVVRLLQRGEFAQARALLRLDVRTFEARYEAGAAAAPTIAVSVHGTLSRLDGRLLADRTFEVRQPATDNRVSAIVQSFDQATSQALAQVIAWTDQTAPLAPETSETTTRAPGRAAPIRSTTTTRSTTVVTRPPG